MGRLIVVPTAPNAIKPATFMPPTIRWATRMSTVTIGVDQAVFGPGDHKMKCQETVIRSGFPSRLTGLCDNDSASAALREKSRSHSSRTISPHMRCEWL
jgi:hypothetical protein